MISKKTITSIFMVPTLKASREELHKNGFINAFINDVDRDCVPDNSIFLLFKPKNLLLFKEFLDSEYERTKNVIEDYDYEGGYVVVVYQLNSAFNKDFNLIKRGRYSQTSKEFQKLFPKKIKLFNKPNVGEQISLQYMIFNKDPKLIVFWEDKIGEDSLAFAEEYWPTFETDMETLNIKQIIENDNKKSIK